MQTFNTFQYFSTALGFSLLHQSATRPLILFSAHLEAYDGSLFSESSCMRITLPVFLYRTRVLLTSPSKHSSIGILNGRHNLHDSGYTCRLVEKIHTILLLTPSRAPQVSPQMQCSYRKKYINSKSSLGFSTKTYLLILLSPLANQQYFALAHSDTTSR